MAVRACYTRQSRFERATWLLATFVRSQCSLHLTTPLGSADSTYPLHLQAHSLCGMGEIYEYVFILKTQKTQITWMIVIVVITRNTWGDWRVQRGKCSSWICVHTENMNNMNDRDCCLHQNTSQRHWRVQMGKCSSWICVHTENTNNVNDRDCHRHQKHLSRRLTSPKGKM